MFLFIFVSALIGVIVSCKLINTFICICQSDELEEGEIAMSGDSLMDVQQSGSWNHERDEGEDEQVLQPKIKRKRSIRIRPRQAIERPEERSRGKPLLSPTGSSQLPLQMDHKYVGQFRTVNDHNLNMEPNVYKNDNSDSSLKTRRGLPSRRTSNSGKVHTSLKPNRVNSVSAPSEDAAEQSRESWDGKGLNGSGSPSGNKMSDVVQRKVLSIVILKPNISCLLLK